MTRPGDETVPRDELSRTFAALADPTRRAILGRLAEGEATVGELAAPFAMSLPAVSRHLRVLERAGLVSKGREAQWRPCRLEVGELRRADEWLAPYRDFFETRFDRLEDHLRTMAATDAVEADREPGDPPGSAPAPAPAPQTEQPQAEQGKE
jgi:DNA-binding transcriptional ArsR family regulator